MKADKFDIGKLIAGVIEYKYYFIIMWDKTRYRFAIYSIPEFTWGKK